MNYSEHEKEGVIKYKYELVDSFLPGEDSVLELESIRKILFDMKFIGADETGLCYGNVSRLLRRENGKNVFVITGSQTGNLPELSATHYCTVIDYDYDRFWIMAAGKIKPSSEALTHAAIYDSYSGIKCIIHIHDKKIWNFMIENKYTITGKFEYGTREMAREIQNLSKKGFNKGNIFAMSGHESGIISFGKTSDEALKNIQNILKLIV